MRIIRLSFIILLLSSCETFKPFFDQVAHSITDFSDNVKRNSYERAKDSENWDIVSLDTALNEEYLSYVERNVILELNKVRSNPKKYADLYIKPMLSRYHGKEYRYRDAIYLTKEGKKAAEECISVLYRTRSMEVLKPYKELYLLAKDHVEAQGPTGQTGHDSPAGESFKRRIIRVIGNIRYIGENIDYGNNNARKIVISLLVDDGVPSRGHRKNILKSQYSFVGVAIGDHKTYKTMCVIDFGRY